MGPDLSLPVVLNLGQVFGELLHAFLEAGGLGVGVVGHLPHQDIGLVAKPGGFAAVGGKHLTHLVEMLLHVADVLLDPLGLVVPETGKQRIRPRMNNENVLRQRFVFFFFRGVLATHG